MPKVVYLNKVTAENFFDDLQERFRDQLESTDRGRSTRIYLGEIRRFAGWITQKYGQFNPDAITPLDVVEYRKYLQDKNKAPATINRILTVLRVFFDWLEQNKEVRDNPVKHVKSIAINDQPAPKWLIRMEQVALVHAVRDSGSTRNETMVTLMLHAGLRVGEVCALQREDVKISERKGLVRVRSGKGNKFRQVPLNKTARAVISRWMEMNPEGPLFPGPTGEPIKPRTVFNFVTEYAYQAHLEDVTPHTLRHCFCKNLVDLGVPIDQVAMLAGHSSLDVTKRYTAPSIDDLQAAVDRAAWE